MQSKRLLGASATIDNSVYIIGGAALDGTVVPNRYDAKSMVWIYDTVANTWDNSAASMPEARYGHAAAVVNGIVYIFGGANASDAVMDTVWTYDPVGDTWDNVSETPMLSPRMGMAIAAIDNDVYLVGGIDQGGAAVDTVEVYDTGVGVWTAMPSLPSARKFAAAVAYNGLIYCTGGIDASNTILAGVISLDPLGVAWQSEGSLQIAVFGHAAGVIGSKLYLANGCNKYRSHSGWDGFFQSFYPATGTSEEHAMFFWGHYHIYFGVVGERFYVFGGHKGKVETNWPEHMMKNTAYYDVSKLSP